MSLFKELPAAGGIVIAVIIALFFIAVIMLFATYARYRALSRSVNLRSAETDNRLLDEVKDEYAAAYRDYGENTNTPAIIGNLFSARLSGSLLAERFMNAAVSAFVTLGLFGTFLGLSLSVSSLTELISLSGTEEWLNILNSVGGGLVSALSGMGVAFYTSLVGVACGILFTLLRTVFNPQAEREKLETLIELWLDHTVSPTLSTTYAADDAERLIKLSNDIRSYAETVRVSLNAATTAMDKTLRDTTSALGQMIEYSKEPLTVFYDTVNTFGQNVRDFSEINYDLRGSIERMDVTVRDFSSAVRKSAAHVEAERK